MKSILESIELVLKQRPRPPIVLIPASWSITELGPLPPGFKVVDGKIVRCS